jgi:hypothetical protein
MTPLKARRGNRRRRSSIRQSCRDRRTAPLNGFVR